MWLLFIVSAYLYASVSGDVGDSTPVFKKCCLKSQGLVRVVDAEDNVRYECLDRESVESDYNVFKAPLIVGDAVPVQYGVPNQSCVLSLAYQTSEELDVRLTTTSDNCYDRLFLETINGSVNSHISKIISLSCVYNETGLVTDTKLTVNHIRKCCAKGQSYDTVDHLCKKSEESATGESLLKTLNMNSDSIYEIETGLNCKYEQYAIELSEQFYDLKVVGSDLKVAKKDGSGGGEALQGEWCVEQQYGRSGLVARACSVDCARFGAYCVRKCCPVGEHYRTRRCGSPVSSCVVDNNDIPFDISVYIDPLSVYGIGGKYIANDK